MMRDHHRPDQICVADHSQYNTDAYIAAASWQVLQWDMYTRPCSVAGIFRHFDVTAGLRAYQPSVVKN